MSKKLNHFKQWVFWTGIFNIVTYSSFLCPFTFARERALYGKRSTINVMIKL